MSVLEAMRKTLAQLDREAAASNDPVLARIRDQMLHSIQQLEQKRAARGADNVVTMTKRD